MRTETIVAPSVSRIGSRLSPSLVRYGDPATVEVELVCFPAAGEPASRFAAWRPHLDARFGLVAVERAGRGRRMAEPPQPDLESIVREVVSELATSTQHPLVLVGHSAGSLVAHAVTAALESTPMEVLGVVACHGRSPTIDRPIPWSALDDDALVAAVRNGRPAAGSLLDRADFVDVFLPAFRADLSLYERTESACAPVSVPLIALGGCDDALVPPPDIRRWRDASKGTFVSQILSGDHFVPVDEPAILLETLLPLLATYVLGTK